MNEVTVKLLESVGDVSFGMERSKVREILGSYREFKKSRYSKTTTDDFGICHVYYDIFDKCIAVEFFDDANIKIGNQTIVLNDYSVVCDILKNMDNKLEVDSEGCISKSYSIGIYAPDKKIESILFGKEGYYSV